MRTMWGAARWLAAAVLVAMLAGGCGRDRRPNVLLITIDTLRPDALGWIGGRNATPAIDALAREGFRFRHAVTPTPLTLPAHTSIMTGLVPRRHGVRDNGQVLGDAAPTLAATLGAHGWTTAAFVSGYPLRALFGLDRGFGHYDDRLPTGSEGWLERPAPDTTVAALTWMEPEREPWFVWVHFYDPHDPYVRHADLAHGGDFDAYDSEVAFTDRAIADLIGGARAGGRSLVTVLAGDHGESFGEHREWTHGFFLYDTTMLVPLIVHAPGLVAPGESAAVPRLVDVAPTLLDLLGLTPLEHVDGTSLVPTLRGGTQTLPPAYLETQQPLISYGWAPLRAVRSADRKLVVAPRPELYDLVADPGETTNLATTRPEDLKPLQEILAATEASPEATAARSSAPEVAERLRALGYLDAATSPPAAWATLPDPKDRIAERDRLLGAEEQLRHGALREAVASFDAVLAVDPDNRFAVLRSGIALLKLGELEQAIPRLTRAVALDPSQAETHFALADALSRTRRYDAAIAEWRETVRLQPRRTAAWANLGTVLAVAGRRDEARAALERALALDPANASLRASVDALAKARGER